MKKSVAGRLLEEYKRLNRKPKKVNENYGKVNPSKLPAIISDGTMRPEDVIPALWNWAFDNEAQEKEFLREQNIRSYDDIFKDRDTMDWVKDALWDICEQRAPEGFYFGTAEGDPACVGFFEEGEGDYF